MPPKKSLLFSLVDATKPTIEGKTTKCPCKWCTELVAMNARDLKQHFLKICKKIPVGRQDEVATACSKIGRRS